MSKVGPTNCSGNNIPSILSIKSFRIGRLHSRPASARQALNGTDQDQEVGTKIILRGTTYRTCLSTSTAEQIPRLFSNIAGLCYQFSSRRSFSSTAKQNPHRSFPLRNKLLHSHAWQRTRFVRQTADRSEKDVTIRESRDSPGTCGKQRQVR